MDDDFENDRYAASVDPSVQCTACDAVCCRLTVIVMPEDDVPDWLVTYDDHGLAMLAKGDDGWCAAVDPDTSRCTIYAQRPAICRKYAMGSPGCRDERRKWYGPSIPMPVKLL